MTSALPAIDAALEQWHQWQVRLPGKPEVVEPLSCGLSNQSYLLKAGDELMALRLNSQQPLPGIDRQREATIWRAAFQAGIAPALLYAGEKYLVSAFIPDETFSPEETGKTWSREDLTKDDLATEVFRVMSKCHATLVDAEEINYAQHIQAYCDRVDNSSELLKQHQEMQDTLATLLAQHPEMVLCHHDLVMANFVGSPERLYLIDWEYAAKGLAVMDYAALAVEWGFSDALICSHTHIRLDSLVMAKKLYRYMCQLWALAHDPQKTPAGAGVV